MNYIEKQQMKPYGLYMWTHRSNIRIKVCEPNMLCDEIMKPEGLSKSVKHTKWPYSFAYHEMNNDMMKWIKKWWNEQWNDEILEGLSKSVKHTKWPSALAYDEMKIHVKWGE